jgi:hypothetical protein
VTYDPSCRHCECLTVGLRCCHCQHSAYMLDMALQRDRRAQDKRARNSARAMLERAREALNASGRLSND